LRPELVRDDVREGRFAEPGRAEQQDVIEGFTAVAGRFDEDVQLFPYGGLTDVIPKQPGP
jgi:hypothetical protein